MYDNSNFKDFQDLWMSHNHKIVAQHSRGIKRGNKTSRILSQSKKQNLENVKSNFLLNHFPALLVGIKTFK